MQDDYQNSQTQVHTCKFITSWLSLNEGITTHSLNIAVFDGKMSQKNTEQIVHDTERIFHS